MFWALLPHFLVSKTRLHHWDGFLLSFDFKHRLNHSHPVMAFTVVTNAFFFKKLGHSRPLFIYFHLFNTVDNKQMLNKILPMTGVEPRTSGIESVRSTNWATTTSQSPMLMDGPQPEPIVFRSPSFSRNPTTQSNQAQGKEGLNLLCQEVHCGWGSNQV